MITFSRMGNYGQLGNQLFQAAMLIGVSAKTGFQIKIPKNLTAKKKAGLYELDKFKITAGELSPSEYKQIKHSFNENGYEFEFNSTIFEQSDFTDFHGYFQTEKYFSHCADLVRKEFQFIDPIDEYARLFVEQNRTESCITAIHVRLGDYLERPDAFTVIKAEWIEQAKLNENIPYPTQYFVFSEDLEWCRNNLSNENTVFIQSPSHWHDLAIMSKCDAHIISASTFSWWAAWLANSKTVIAPWPWFPLKGPLGNVGMRDIIPERWINQEAT